MSMCQWFRTLLGEFFQCLFNAEGVLYFEDAASAALERVKVCSGAKCFAQIACECADVCAFAACHADRCMWQAKGRVVGDVYTTGCVKIPFGDYKAFAKAVIDGITSPVMLEVNEIEELRSKWDWNNRCAMMMNWLESVSGR